MFSKYIDILNGVSPLSKESRIELSKYIHLKKVKKGDFLLNHGEICKHIYFVNKGFLRVFYFKNGKNITEWFANEKQFCFSIISYFEEIPSKLVIEAIQNSEIILLSKEGLGKLRKNNIEIANLFSELLAGSLIGSQIRMESLQFESAKQRYNNLLRDQPEILNKVPLQYIATFLGITQETLSRIRSQA